MKKLILTLFVSLGVLSARAGWNSSELNIRMFDNSLFTIVLDGYDYGQFSTAFSIPDLKPGNHYLKVFRYCRPSGIRPGFNEMVYSGFVKVKPSRIISGMISPDYRFVVLDEMELFPRPHGPGNHGGYGNWNYEGNDESDNYGGGYYPTYMSDGDFMELKSIVGNATFDDTKLTLCKQAISANNICSSQVRDLMMLLTFESNKLELAKFAYAKVIDKNKYFMVNDAFTFSSSVDELNDYINGL